MAHTTLRQAVARYIKDPHSGPQSAQSRDKYRATLSRFAMELPMHKTPGGVTLDDLLRFLRGAEVAASTRRTYMNRLDSFFNWCVLKHLSPQNYVPMARPHFPEKVKPVKRHNWLTQEQVEQVYSAVKARATSDVGRDRDLAILRLGFASGLRRQEITEIRWVDLDFERQSLKIRGKGDKLAEIWLPGRTMNLLGSIQRDYLECSSLQEQHDDDTIIAPIIVHDNGIADFRWGRKLSLSAINQAVARANVWSGLEFSPHDMRRTYAGILDERGYGIEAISKALRHSNYGVTQRYLQSRQDAAFQAVEGLEL